MIIRSTLNLWTSSSLANLFPSGIQEWKKLGATDMLNDSLVIDDCRESTIKRNVPNNNTSKCCVTIGNEKIILWISKYFSSDSVGAPITSNNNRSFCWPKIPLGSLRRNFFNTDAIVCTENCSRFTRRPFYRMFKTRKKISIQIFDHHGQLTCKNCINFLIFAWLPGARKISFLCGASLFNFNIIINKRLGKSLWTLQTSTSGIPNLTLEKKQRNEMKWNDFQSIN